MNEVWIMDLTDEIPEEIFNKIQLSWDTLCIELDDWNKYKPSLYFNIPRIGEKALLKLKKYTITGLQDVDFNELGIGTSHILYTTILNTIIEIWKEDNIDWVNVMEKIADRVAKLISNKINEEVLTKSSLTCPQDWDSWKTYRLWTMNKTTDKIVNPIDIKRLNHIRV